MRDRIIKQRIKDTRKSILLLGPRQVGKSTLCQSLNPNKTINLAEEDSFISYAKDPSKLKREVLTLPPRSLIFIDEVQRIPSLLNSIQAIIDTKELSHRFLLSGSSARKLKMRGANLLPGRVILEHLDPLLYWELKDIFDLDRALQVGMLPEVFLDRSEGIDILSTYVDTYLREEIRAEALVKDIGSYARFLDVAAIVSGQWLNYSKLSSESEIPKETIRRYFSILEDTLLVFRLPSFQPKRRISRRVAQKDKFVFFDVGVRNSLLGHHRKPPSVDQIGPIFEQWFTLQVFYLNRAFKKAWTLSSYRTEGGAEVDLVVEREEDILGIEIKSSRNVGGTDWRGLRSLEEVVGKYKPFKKVIAFRGNEKQVFEKNEWAIPFAKVFDLLMDED